MQFISRLLLSWAMFFFLLAQAVEDDNLVAVLLPVLWLPPLLFVAALTYLVYDTILPQISPKFLSKAALLGRVNLAGLIAPVAPAAQITPAMLGVDVIDRAQVPTWHGLPNQHTIILLLATFILGMLITWLWNQLRLPHVRPVSSSSYSRSTVGRFPNLFRGRRSHRGSLVSTSQRIDFFCPSHAPYTRPSNDSESGATLATLNQIGPNHAPAVTPPTPVENKSPKSLHPDQPTSELLRLLEWNFTGSSAFQDEDDEDMFEEEEEQWWDTDDQQPIQIKEVVRGVVPLPSHVDGDVEEDEGAIVSSTSTWAPISGLPSRPLIPIGVLNPNIESLELRLDQEAIQFPSRTDEKDEDISPSSTQGSTGARRARLVVPAQRPDPKIQSLPPRGGQVNVPPRSCNDKNEDEEDQATRDHRPSTTRPPTLSHPLPPMPIPSRHRNAERLQSITTLPTCFEEGEEQEEEEEDSPDQGLHSWSGSSSKPYRDASTSTTSTAVEAPTNTSETNPCGKPSAMKKSGAPSKMASVSWNDFVKIRELPVTIYDWKARSCFVSEEEEKELDEEYLRQTTLAALGDEEAEGTNPAPFEQGELSRQPSRLSWSAEPQANAVSERVKRGGRLGKVFTKLSPIRFGKRLFKKRTGPL